jgi:uncharacterized protein YutE (UPF0331/DUF86 family)
VSSIATLEQRGWRRVALVDRDTFDRRLARLEETLRELRGVVAEGEARFRADTRTRAAAERWLHLAAECAIDLAHQLIADQGWRTPATYREAFQILADEGVISEERCRTLEGWAGLRNVLVHLYTRVDDTLVWRAMTRDLDGLEQFAREIVRSIK